MESGNDYVLQVKGNQPKLLSAIKQTISTTRPVDSDSVKEKNRGRIERRSVYVYSALENPIYKDWASIKSVIHVVSQGNRNSKEYLENRYYITSLNNTNAKLYNERIRDHWGIENRLHWVKDATLKEDKSLVKDLDRSETMSIVRNMVINLYRISGISSTKYAIEAFNNKISKCVELIYNKYVYD